MLSTLDLAELCRRDKTRLYEVFNEPKCKAWLPPKRGIGEGREFNPRQAMLTMIHSDLNRWGLSVPFAGSVVTRLAEELYSHPDADSLTINFHENGASFFAAGQGYADLSSADNGAGALRFRLTLDLAAYRSAISAAMEAENVAA